MKVKMEKLMSSLIVLSLITSCSLSENMELTEFDSAVDSIMERNKPGWIFVGDYNIVEILKDIGVKHFTNTYSDEFDFYYCDISKEYNEHVNYIYQLEALPSAMLITPKDGIIYITRDNLNDVGIKSLHSVSVDYLSGVKLEFINSNFTVHDKDLSELYNDTYTAYRALNSNVDDIIEQGIKSIETSINIEPYFYNYYLAFRLHKELGCLDKSDLYKDNAIKWFDKNKVLLYTYLCLEIAQGDNTYYAEISLDDKTIDLGEISPNTVAEKVLYYKNTGTAPLLIINAATSCSCVNVIWGNAIAPGESGEIIIKYNADNNYGPFNKTILLVTNTLDGGVTLSVKGSIQN